MIKSKKLLEILEDSLNKKEILQKDLEKIEDLSLNKKNLNGLENDIELKELEYFTNVKTLTIANFKINKEIINIINKQRNLCAIQFSKCEFEDIVPINKNIKYIIIDKCKNFNLGLLNDNEIIRIIDE